MSGAGVGFVRLPFPNFNLEWWHKVVWMPLPTILKRFPNFNFGHAYHNWWSRSRVGSEALTDEEKRHKCQPKKKKKEYCKKKVILYF